MKDIYLVSDVHGNYEGLLKALYDANLFDNHGEKDPRAYIVQIGDIANCVRDSVAGDLACLGTIGNKIDVMLPGNHEIPYFDPQNTFSGFHYDEEVGDKLHALNEAGLINPCYQFNDILITHAGITNSLLTSTMPTAWDVADKLEREWSAKNFGHSLFRACGRYRYGRDTIGGTLWCDFDNEFEPTIFPQIVGHTPDTTIRVRDNAICIDTGAKYNGRTPTVLKLGVRR